MTLVKQKSGNRVSYTAKQKLMMVKFAEEHGNRAAERRFDVCESNIRSWRKLKNRLEALPEDKMADRGSGALYPELESVMSAFIKEKQFRCEPASFQDIKNHAQEIGKMLQLSAFRASDTWVYAFMRRYRIKGSGDSVPT